MLPILPVFLLLSLGICPAEVDGFDPNALKKTKEDAEDVPKQVVFDQEGILIIDGTVPGTSDPITVDRKPLLETCSYKPYYKFTICPKDKNKFLEQNETIRMTCDNGIILCYEGQLNKHRVREQFVLPRVKNEISVKCKEFNGFKLALRYLIPAGLREPKPYLEVDTSFTEEPYFYPLPGSHCLDLALGTPSDIMASVRSLENDEQMIKNEAVYYKNKTIGTRNVYENDDDFDKAFGALPNVTNKDRLRDVTHMKMLYLDFRAYYYSPQMMMAIVPEGCNMIIRIRSNVLRTCKSEFKQKNFALRSLNDKNVSTEYALTVESGTDEWKTSGSRSGKSSGQSQSSETSSSTIEETSETTGLQTESESINRNSDTNTKTSGKETKSEWGASASASAGVQGGSGGASGGVEVGASISYLDSSSSGSTDTQVKYSAQEGRQSHSETSSNTKISILETFFRSTQTSINTQKKQSFNSQSVGIQKRTIYKWIIKVPPGKVMTPMQMTVNCDGAKVQIPQMKFVVTEEGDDLPTPDYEEGSTL